MEKKTARVLRRIQKVRGLSEAEKYLFARSLVATPDERWLMHESFLRSHDLYTRSSRRKYGFQVAGMSGAILQGVPATTLDTDLWVPSKRFVGRPKDLAHLPLLQKTIRLQRRIRRA